MGNKACAPEKFKLSEFRKRKLMHEFNTFYDMNKDGQLQWKDFVLARNNICEKSGWLPGSPKWQQAIDLFQDIWQHLQDSADYDVDGTITPEEWVHLWTSIVENHLAKQQKEKGEGEESEEEEIPVWLEKYIRYKFDLYDRTGDGHIDVDEFEYVLAWFDVPGADCRKAFTILSLGGKKKLDFEYFRSLVLEFFLTDDEAAAGNYINGKLDYS